MIVWSKGLGKQRLPLELPDATLRLTRQYRDGRRDRAGVLELCEPRLEARDLKDFLGLMATPAVARVLAEKPGVLLPFLAGVISILPRLVMKKLAGQHVPAAAKG